MANKIGDRGRLVSTSVPVRSPALAISEDDAAGYYPPTAIAVGPAGNLKTPAKIPTLSERTCLRALVRGIRYRSRGKHHRWYFPSSRMTRIKKVWCGKKVGEIAIKGCVRMCQMIDIFLAFNRIY